MLLNQSALQIRFFSRNKGPEHSFHNPRCPGVGTLSPPGRTKWRISGCLHNIRQLSATTKLGRALDGALQALREHLRKTIQCRRALMEVESCSFQTQKQVPQSRYLAG